MTVLSPTLANLLSAERGKYWRWAKSLGADHLEALLWAIGEFASRWTSLSLPGVGPPEPEFSPHNMAEDRMRNALKVFAKAHSLGRVPWEYGPFRRNAMADPDELTEHVSAFSEEFRERLAQGRHTAWAQGLDERSLGMVLWMVGEYGIRVNSSRGPDRSEYPPPSFDAAPEVTAPMRVALGLIARIERSEPITVAEVRRRIAEAGG